MSRNAFAPIQWAMSVPPMLLPNGRVDTDAHHVLVVLASYADPDGSGARPTLETLARRSYRSHASAERALTACVAAGLISQTGTYGGTPVWALHLAVVPHGRTVLDERAERKRDLAAARQQRRREALRHAREGRDVTHPKGVTRHGVEGRDVTQGKGVSHAPEGRDVTQGSASHPQVTGGVPALIDLPETCQNTPTPRERAGDAFDRFWAVYPKKTSKAGARRKFETALKTATAEEIIAGAERYARERAADPRPDAAHWTKYPTTWLTNGCWEDEPAPPLRAVSGGYQPYRNPTDQSIYDEDLT